MITVAILGGDEETVALAAALAADRRFLVVGVYDARHWDERFRAILPGVPRSDAWETLLVAGPRVVLVGAERSPELADDQLRKLVQAGVAILLPQPVGEAILALELEMIRRDTDAPLAVRFPGSRHPAVRRVATLVRATPHGAPRAVEQILFERHDSRRGRDAVLAQFARDVTWWLTWTSDVRQVSALGASDTADELSNLSVQMTSAAGQLVRWSVQPAARNEPDCVRLVAGESRITLTMPRDGSAWRVVDSAGLDESYPAPAAADDVEFLVELAQVAEAAATRKSSAFGSKNGDSPNGNSPTRDLTDAPASPEQFDAAWGVAVRALETLDAVLVSLKRGRTVELQKTQVSEQRTFKGMMSAVGCLLLLLAPLCLIGAAVVDRLQASFRPRAAPEISRELLPDGGRDEGRDGTSETGDAARTFESPRKLPWLGILLAAPLVVFLALQSLHLVFPRREASADE